MTLNKWVFWTRRHCNVTPTVMSDSNMNLNSLLGCVCFYTTISSKL